MRFSAQVKDAILMQNIASTLGSVQDRCMIQITESIFRIIVVVPETGAQVWATLSCSHLFGNFLVSSNEDNIINLDLSLNHIASAFRSRADYTMRLTRKGNMPFLRVVVSEMVVHDIPVRIVREETSNLQEPDPPELDVAIRLPSGLHSGYTSRRKGPQFTSVAATATTAALHAARITAPDAVPHADSATVIPAPPQSKLNSTI
ncbi:hypothetical protein CANCADRAFT_46196 [Tortispora caseinolytica NRRL Y-17796]|uniref:Checkpoint protein n=1 Tax=Tortispora caseinolytica NRRL Y-17796 TaxID=767744 RepID=A0A1E4TDK0_9ASCO|nr:hypothetical protein CANCADRAFT_46196 [Tortispora caseinolytica NRRL Y-17796]